MIGKLKYLWLGLFATIAVQQGNAQHLAWEEVAQGVWKAVVGTPENFDLFSVAEINPKYDALERIPKAGFPFPQEEILTNVVNGKTYLRFPLERGEQIFGFGLNFKTVLQRGRIMRLHVDHYGGNDNGRTHAPVPFYVSDAGYGVFINSARYIDVWAGTAVRKDSKNPPEILDRNTDRRWTSRPYSDGVEMLVPAPGTEIYIFEGPTALDAVRRYNLYCGGGALPPRWGLGFTHRVPTLYDAEKVKQEIQEFRDRGYPIDFVGLEPGWQSKAYPCTFEWDKSRFPDPAGFIKEMDKLGVKVNLWTNPYVSPYSPIYDKIKPLTGSHTVWGGLVPDLTIPEAQKIFKDQLNTDQISIGVSGYKIDEVDGYDRWLWPDVATFPSGLDAEQLRQTYGLLTQKITTELYRKNNIRTWGLVRASNGGASAFPYVIYNDYYSHEDFITALINSSFSGILWTPEVRGSRSGEEWLRRMQSVCFSPMAMLNAWSSGTKPWSFKDVEDEVREIALLRMQLMPYFYSEFAKYHFEGIPPFRAMNLEPGFKAKSSVVAQNQSLEENPYAEALLKEIKDQYMAGEYLLVAPMFTGQTSRTVILPEGKWYDFFTGEFVGGGEIITVTPGLNKIPVYVKEGGIIPMMAPLTKAPESKEKVDLTIKVYGNSPSTYMLYDDDGTTFDFEKGHYSWREIKIEKLRNGNLRGSISRAVKGKPDNVGKVEWQFMSKE
jgi:alpha-glucosidase (family GH31 glycosyl hydrolase)